MSNCKVVGTAVALFLLAHSLLSALSISINVSSPENISFEKLSSISRSRMVDGEVRYCAVLEELLPVFESLEAIEIGGDEPHRIPLRQDDPVYTLYRCYVLPEPDGSMSLAKETDDGKTELYLTGVREIRITGERLDTDQLEVWISWEGVARLKREVRRWGDLHGIRVTVNEVPKSDSKLLSVLRGGGRPPDVILVQSDYLPSLTAAGALQPLTRYPVEKFVGKSLEALSLDGTLWAVPFYFDAQLMFYRKDLVELPGTELPGETGMEPDCWTLEVFEETARELKRQGIAPVSWNAYSAYWLVPFQIGFGKHRLLEPDGSIRVDDDTTRDAVTYVKRLADEGLLDLRERDSMFSRFISGDVAMMLSASFSIPELERLGVPFGVVSFPAGPEGPVSPLLDFKGFAVSRKTRHPLLARRFLLSMSDSAVQQEFTGELYKLPVTEPAWRMAEMTNAYFPVLRYSYETGTVVPSTMGYKVYKNTMWQMLRFILTGKIPVSQGLEKSQALIQSKMSR